MYLSRLILNPRSRRARTDIANPYEMHRTVMRAFPDEADGGPGRVLFRLDSGATSSALFLLVQSDKPPDWSFLSSPDAGGYLLEIGDPEHYNPDSKRIDLFSLAAPQRLFRFRLRANPTVKRNGRRRAILKEEEQAAWLHRKASDAGFSLTGLRITPENAVTARRNGSARLTFNSALFDGILRVTDTHAFKSALAAGIGPAKGFGFGLLSLAPPG